MRTIVCILIAVLFAVSFVATYLQMAINSKCIDLICTARSSLLTIMVLFIMASVALFGCNFSAMRCLRILCVDVFGFALGSMFLDMTSFLSGPRRLRPTGPPPVRRRPKFCVLYQRLILVVYEL